MISKTNKQKGFTLIEMIVSVAIFSIVATITVGALLILIGTNQQLQTEQNIMTNLSFALDSMTREIRTGTNYYCVSRVNYANGGPSNFFTDGNDPDAIGSGVNDCPTGKTGPNPQLQGISIIESGNSITGTGASRIVYFYDQDAGQLLRRVGNNDAQTIVSSGLFIADAEFFVTGTAPGDDDQPTVSIVIEAQEKDDPASKTYLIQTTVVQRALDI